MRLEALARSAPADNSAYPFASADGAMLDLDPAPLWHALIADIAGGIPAAVTAGRPALAAVKLVADLAMISAVGNDVGFEHVFVRQLTAQARSGDALIGISTSGNSANLLAAFEKAKALGLATIGPAGGDGGRMKSSGPCDHCLVVPSASIHRVQECHVAAYHILWDLAHTVLADERGSAAGRELAT
jgi:D-sedoheptulose 7-phosphate isomerase